MEKALALIESLAALVPEVADLFRRLVAGDPSVQQRVEDILPPRDIEAEVK